GSSPLAFEIYNQTHAFGNSVTFLMAGVATDYTEFGLIWSNIGRKAAIWLPIITVPQVLLVGYLFNIFL
ncbi:MAG: ATPase, partial [Euryarchaeota archaeon]|nr:ATPase [Euryarchaeota archaeon]